MATLQLYLVLYFGLACSFANAKDVIASENFIHSSCMEAFHCAHCNSQFPESGFYNLTGGRVYCDMEGPHCGGKGGWTRVGQLDMRLPNSVCPGQLTEVTKDGRKVCSRPLPGCSFVLFTIPNGVHYKEVCGFVAGYQDKTTDGFHGKEMSIDAAYLDGISITRGSPRKHIWSLAVGYSESSTPGSSGACPCNIGGLDRVPDFVGNDYYCESGNPSDRAVYNFFPDILWNGRNCPSKETPCCISHEMPYFHVNLGESSTNNIELRLCHDQPSSDEDVPIEAYEIFVR